MYLLLVALTLSETNINNKISIEKISGDCFKLVECQYIVCDWNMYLVETHSYLDNFRSPS